jgi:hypothetical protein
MFATITYEKILLCSTYKAHPSNVAYQILCAVLPGKPSLRYLKLFWFTINQVLVDNNCNVAKLIE